MKLCLCGCLCLLLILVSCDIGQFGEWKESKNYRDEMKSLVVKIANRARMENSQFIVVTNNGQELLTNDSDFYSGIDYSYTSNLDGVVQQGLFYGAYQINQPTSEGESAYWLKYLKLAQDRYLKVLVCDYCTDFNYIQDSYSKNFMQGFVSFQANSYDLNNIPNFPLLPSGSNNNNIGSLESVETMLMLTHPNQYADKYNYLQALKNCAHDLLVVDAFFKGDSLTYSDVAQLKTKSVGGKRLVLAYLSIGEAERNRYYWQSDWTTNPPEWLGLSSLQNAGNYRVEYWNSRWQSIIADSSASYIKKITQAGFDGVYLDNVESYLDFYQ